MNSKVMQLPEIFKAMVRFEGFDAPAYKALCDAAGSRPPRGELPTKEVIVTFNFTPDGAASNIYVRGKVNYTEHGPLGYIERAAALRTAESHRVSFGARPDGDGNDRSFQMREGYLQENQRLEEQIQNISSAQTRFSRTLDDAAKKMI